MELLAIMNVHNDDAAIWVWIVLGVTFFVAFGWNAFRKIWKFNKKHHIISYERSTDTVTYIDEDEFDENDDWRYEISK